MRHNKIVYSIICITLCGSVAFAAQEPLTPEVTSDNILVAPASENTVSLPQKPAEVVPQKLPLPTPDSSHKLTLPTKDTETPEKPPVIQANIPVKTPSDSTEDTSKGVMVPMAPLSPSLGKLSYLRARLEESRLQVAVAEQEARLRQILMPSPPPAPAVQTMPQIPSIPLDMLLDSQKLKPTKTFAIPAKRSSGVVSIQGVNGILSATIATGKGTVTVKQGDSFGGGKIESISYNQVMVRSGKKTAPIPFVE